METEQEYHAHDAVNQFVQHSCAFLVPGEEGLIAAGVGTGTLIRTTGGHCCILTAKHIAEDARDKQYRLGFFGCSNPIPDFVSGMMLFPDDVDIALLIVKEQFVSELMNLALTQASIPQKEEEGIATEDSLVLIGYPARMLRYSKERSLQGFVSLTYWCQPLDISSDKNDRYKLPWKNAAVWRDERTFDLPAPRGMSGAPLWRFRRLASSSIWSAGEIGRIIAVQAAWDRKDLLFLEPVNKWGAWIHDRFNDIDKNLG
jgi:hypothetical protein